MGRASICQCLLLSTWSPALSFAVSPCSPAAVVVRYVVVSTRSRGPGKIAVPRERLYRNSDCQISQVILSGRTQTLPPFVIALHAFASLRCLSEAKRSRRIRFFSPVKNCAALDKESRNSRRGWRLRLSRIIHGRFRQWPPALPSKHPRRNSGYPSALHSVLPL